MNPFNELPLASSMSLRDYFAAKAMQALIGKLPLIDRDGVFSAAMTQDEINKIHQEVAHSAYVYADYMIEARK